MINKKHQSSRQRYQLKRSRWKNKKRKRNGKNEINKSNLTHNGRVFVERVAPKIFNLKPENVNEVITYINQIKSIGKSGKWLNINLSNVEEIGIGAISMLISVISELNEEGIIIKGTKPKNSDVNNELEQSGFMKFVNGLIQPSNLKTKNNIITGNKDTSHTEILNIIHSSMLTVWDEDGRSPLLYGTIVEMIKNSCKHAFKSDNNVKWHFAVSHDEIKNIAKFSFVDNGIGIVGSYRLGDFFNKARLVFKNNSDFIEGAFSQGIKSKTGLSWRGTGLPTIYESHDEEIIKNFVVITNDVYCNFDLDDKIELQNEFRGTYYYWEIDKSCIKHCFK